MITRPALRRGVAAAAMALALSLTTPAFAQVFGTFPWQMQPYCNVVTLTLTSSPAGFTLDGTDDQCGASSRAGAVGVASFTATGAVALSFSIVTPAGTPVHVSAVVSPATGSGTWTDSTGASGAFQFFGATPGLPPRPTPANVVARPGQLLTGQLAALYTPNTGYALAAGSFAVPLPPGTSRPTLELVLNQSFTATCPATGQATPGRLCVYTYATVNVGSIAYASLSTGLNRLHGFALMVTPTNATAGGSLLANWAYVQP